MIEETKSNLTFAKYGVFIENAAERIGWHDILNSLIYLPIERINARNNILTVG